MVSFYKSMEKNMISITITSKNESLHLPRLLKSLKLQTFKDFETIVVDNASTDGTKDIARKFGARVFDKGPERSAQRNYGVQVSRGQYILVLDADMTLAPGVLADCIGVVTNDPKVGALIIPEKSFGIGFWTKYKVFEREFYVGDKTIEAPRFFKKTTFKKFNGYDTGITGPEDYDLPLRMRKAGVKIGRIKSYIYHDEGRFSPFKSAKKKYYYASHSGTFLKRHPEQVLSLGNLILRPIFFKKWKKMISHPGLTLGMLIVKIFEGTGAFLGAINSGIIVTAKHDKNT